MQVAELSAKIADTLRTHGWCQYALEDEQGRMCLLGALNFAVSGSAGAFLGEDPDQVQERARWLAAAEHRLYTDLGYKFSKSIVTYNNDDSRTEEEIYAFLERVR